MSEANEDERAFLIECAETWDLIADNVTRIGQGQFAAAFLCWELANLGEARRHRTMGRVPSLHEQLMRSRPPIHDGFDGYAWWASNDCGPRAAHARKLAARCRFLAAASPEGTT